MNADAAVRIFIGVACIAFGCLNRDFDFGGPGRISFGEPIKVPRWVGVTIFLAVGGVLLFLGVRKLS
jgi:hypothetical protein